MSIPISLSMRNESGSTSITSTSMADTCDRHYVSIVAMCWSHVTYLRHIVVSSFTLLLLQFDGNASDGRPLDPFHKMSDKAGDLVAKTLRWDDRDLFANPFVGVEVKSQSSVVLLDYHSRRLLNGLCPDATLKADKESVKTIKSIVIGIIPFLTIHGLWRMSEKEVSEQSSD